MQYEYTHGELECLVLEKVDSNFNPRSLEGGGGAN